jgi:tryptophan-rich sensory protein
MKSGEIAKLIISMAAVFATGAVGSLFTSRAIPTWYKTLTKPRFSPPNWLFGPAWTVLYVLMAVAAYLVWRNGFAAPGVKAALAVFLVQLVLNALWSGLFFGLRSPLAGLIGIVALWLAILATIVLFLGVSTLAGALLLPYIGWVSFAAILNAAILRLNH